MKRKRIIYEHMKRRECGNAHEIGADDGVFWMSMTDFFLNFDDLYLCRVFDGTWTKLSFDDCWSIAANRAGGCTNNEKTCG